MFDFEIIDSHVHPFISEHNNLKWFDSPTSTEEFFCDLKRAGISKCCGSIIRPLDNPGFDDIKALNREAIELRNSYPGAYVPGINVHGAFPKESCAEIEQLYKEENIRWLGELVAYMMAYSDYASENMFQVYDLAQHLNLIVNIHPYGLDEIEKICRNFPSLNIVIAHPTSNKGSIEERLEFVHKYSNAYLDLSGSGVFRWGVLRRGINESGKHKFLFGSDYPICNPAMMIQGILFEHLSDDELEAVFSGNFKRLAGLPQSTSV
jgi:predicted TIM-barrel fold metal-dependent hydrolase